MKRNLGTSSYDPEVYPMPHVLTQYFLYGLWQKQLYNCFVRDTET
jgi:hypothetical protein